MARIAVCGLGYVGLVTATCFAELGHEVNAYDADATTVHRLRCGDVPFYEPHLEPMLRGAMTAGRLRFFRSTQAALAERQAVFIAVGTPVDPVGAADLTFVRQAARDIARCASGELIVVNKSTVPVETADLVARIIEVEAGAALRARVASNPEFLREGRAVRDFLHPERIVIGSEDATAVAFLRELYADLDAPVLVVPTRTAEVIKYAANAFLAIKISYANELASFCDAVGVDVRDVTRGLAYDRRIGAAYLRPGLGYGGSCLPKDVNALAEAARRRGVAPTLLDAAAAVNERQVGIVLQHIERVTGNLDRTPLAVLGLAFKPGTDDVRGSPAIALVNALCARGARVACHDPVAANRARTALDPRSTLCTDLSEALAGAQCAVLATEWPLYCSTEFLALMRCFVDPPRLFDARNAQNARDARAAGVEYYAVGHAETRRPVAS
jgi:UDPglucose 6-dehydrogenase